MSSVSVPQGKGAGNVWDADRADAEEARRAKIAELRKQIAEKAALEDYAGAAMMKAELRSLEEVMIQQSKICSAFKHRLLFLFLGQN